MKSKVNFFYRGFFRSPTVKHYVYRICLASLIFILFTIIEILIWLKLDLVEVNYENSAFVFFADCLLITTTMISILKFICINKTEKSLLMNNINFLFYVSFFIFLLNLAETVYTLFGSFLSYFECRILIN